MKTVITVSFSPEILLETENVLVRRMSLAPHEIAPLHFHTQVHEHIVCLNGKIAVQWKTIILRRSYYLAKASIFHLPDPIKSKI